MITVDILIAPLRILITALGTGVLPTDDPETALRLLTESLSIRSHQFTAYLAWITPEQP